MCGVWVSLTVEGAEDRQDSLEQLTSEMKCGPVCVSLDKNSKKSEMATILSAVATDAFFVRSTLAASLEPW